jgi:hypothetical protein
MLMAALAARHYSPGTLRDFETNPDRDPGAWVT